MKLTELTWKDLKRISDAAGDICQGSYERIADLSEQEYYEKVINRLREMDEEDNAKRLDDENTV